MKKDALILALITLVAGLLLGGVYELTKGAREKQAEITKNNAYRAVFEDSKDFSFEEVELKEIKDLNKNIKEAGLTDKVIIDGFVIATNKDKEKVGYVVNVTAKEGYGGDISFSVGVSDGGVVTGISILSIAETPGLGMRAEEDDFLNQYVDKNGKFLVNSTGSNGEDTVDAISGATITSNAMTDGVNAALVAYNSYIIGSVPEIPTTTTGGEASNE